MSATVEHRCTSCGAKNRIPHSRLLDDPACGKCSNKLFYAEPVRTTDSTFAQEVAECAIPVLVDFWAPWCGPCRSMEPVLQSLAASAKGRLKVVKVNVDENPGLAQRYAVRSIPALKLFKGNTLLGEMTGAVGVRDLEAFISGHGV